MEKKETVYTSGQPHKLQLDWFEPDPLYRRAFYSHEEDPNSEHSRNTTAWD